MSEPQLQRDPLLQSFLSLSTPNVSDALDHLGVEGTPLGLAPLWPGSGRIVGRALTLRLVGPDEAETSPVDGTLEALRGAQPGDILVIDHGGSLDANSFGGIAAYTASRQGVRGCVIDGVTRDVDEMRDIHFPVFGRGVIQKSVRGRCACAGFGGVVSIGGVTCAPGDIVVADDNGVAIIPHARATEVLEIAHAILGMENRIKDAIARGVDPIEAHEQMHYDDQRKS